jgi:GDP/UDP-N,N'-diacetylbacillosamine 2-epimerase (hydrolysing)
MKVCVITGTRAEYGLLYWTMRGLQLDKKFQLQICVTGMHLSSEFGYTYRQIEQDGFFINKKIEMLLSSDSEIGISKSIGLGIIGFSEALKELNPDLVLLLGDRFEIFSAATAAMILKIPIAHCHGGEATEGLIDESIRHSITKMSQLHFTSSMEYRKRVIQLGEQPNRVYNVGALGVENINKLKLMTRSEFEKSIEFKLSKKFFLITFHPVTLESSTAEKQFMELLISLKKIKETSFIFTMPNADTEGRIIINLINDFVQQNSEISKAFLTLGQVRYLSAIKHCNLVLGNSSSGLIETPSFKKPTINIGDRQKGRVKGINVIDCAPNNREITKAINYALSNLFQKKISNCKSPFGNTNSSEKILHILNKVNLKNIIKKEFYNLH